MVEYVILLTVVSLGVIAQCVGRPFDEAHPLLEARLPDGSRVTALMPPVAPTGPCVAIRRFSKDILKRKPKGIS